VPAMQNHFRILPADYRGGRAPLRQRFREFPGWKNETQKHLL
jgi:hypothetical protein